jgi:hypothetical protein
MKRTFDMHAPRIVQVARCCGMKYSRWRIENRPFPLGITHCCKCRKKLRYLK